MKLTKKQKNCPYCHGKKDIINTLHYEYPNRLGSQLGQAVHIEGNMLVVEEETVESRRINECPMCGRPLSEKAK